METDKERRIRQRAYEIWEREGKPQGRDAEHWQIAEREIAAGEGEAGGAATGETAASSTPAAPPRRRSRAVPKREGEEGAARSRRKAEAP